MKDKIRAEREHKELLLQEQQQLAKKLNEQEQNLGKIDNMNAAER